MLNLDLIIIYKQKPKNTMCKIFVQLPRALNIFNVIAVIVMKL